MSAKIAPAPSYISHIHIHPLSIYRTMHETLRLYHTNVKLTTIVLQVTKALRSQKAGDIQPGQIVFLSWLRDAQIHSQRSRCSTATIM